MRHKRKSLRENTYYDKIDPLDFHCGTKCYADALKDLRPLKRECFDNLYIEHETEPTPS